MNIKEKGFNVWFFMVFLAYLTIYNSSFKTVFGSRIWDYIVFVGYAIMLLIAFISLLKISQTFKQWAYILILVIGSIYYLSALNLNVGIIFVFGLYSITIKDMRTLLKGYYVAFLIAFLCVAIMSMMGILPLRNSMDGTLLLGFRNPNSTGFYLACILSVHWVLNWNKLSITNYLETPIILFMLLKLNDYTAIAVITMLIIFKLFSRVSYKCFDNTIFRLIIISLPMILTFTSIWIGFNYSRFNFMSRLNSIVTSRPAIWSYYLSQYKLNFFGNKISNVISFGINQTIGNGAFDGAYVYFPIVNGVIAFVVFLIMISMALRKLLKMKKYSIVILFIIYIISGFSENQLFIVYQCPVMMLTTLLCSPGFTNNQKEVIK